MSVFLCGNCKKDYNEEYKKPLSIPCGHVFCEECINSFCIKSSEEENHPSTSVLLIKCPSDSKLFKVEIKKIPVCYQILLNLPRNKISESSSHNNALSCARHSTKKIKYFCKTHQVFPCSICVVDHMANGHDLEPFDPNFEKLSHDVNTLTKFLENELSASNEISNGVEKMERVIHDYYSHQFHKIEIYYEKLFQLMNDKKKQIVEIAKNSFTEQKKKIENDKNKNLKKTFFIKSTLKQIDDISSRRSYEEFHKLKNFAHSEFRNLSNSDQINNETPGFAYFSAPMNKFDDTILGTLKFFKNYQEIESRYQEMLAKEKSKKNLTKPTTTIFSPNNQTNNLNKNSFNNINNNAANNSTSNSNCTVGENIFRDNLLNDNNDREKVISSPPNYPIPSSDTGSPSIFLYSSNENAKGDQTSNRTNSTADKNVFFNNNFKRSQNTPESKILSALMNNGQTKEVEVVHKENKNFTVKKSLVSNSNTSETLVSQREDKQESATTSNAIPQGIYQSNKNRNDKVSINFLSPVDATSISNVNSNFYSNSGKTPILQNKIQLNNKPINPTINNKNLNFNLNLNLNLGDNLTNNNLIISNNSNQSNTHDKRSLSNKNEIKSQLNYNINSNIGIASTATNSSNVKNNNVNTISNDQPLKQISLNQNKSSSKQYNTNPYKKEPKFEKKETSNSKEPVRKKKSVVKTEKKSNSQSKISNLSF